MDDSTGKLLIGLSMLILASFHLYEYTTGNSTPLSLWLAGVALLVMFSAVYSGLKTRANRDSG
ncbi:hypothetical protein SAMN04487949_0617 [Halogranum gelatinilyticum]|uniref:Uncharacterized protein n=1 Tax=Halogranum gelatinilyticum TaxID=660521 RepID=A0A1G9PZM3_9EURY|nr:hypothetical protein SAMN04487949_0617 [Halogranum gelatinilyticum]